MIAFLSSMFLVTIAELGDKTQLLALSFAVKYKPVKVLAGIFIALLFLQLLAVTVGQTLAGLIPMSYLKIAIGVSFIGFGVWMLKRDDCDEEAKECKSTHPIGIIIAIATTFFIAELGDKTQLATISLSAKYQSFASVWLGSTAGMVIADGLAVIIGYFAGKKLPQEKIKYASAAIFIIFGVVTLVQVL